MKMTLTQTNALVERADKLFLRAARAWERGSNSGNGAGMERGEKHCEGFRKRAEALLSPFGIVVDYPGLYPSFMAAGFSYHTTESAVSAIQQAQFGVLINTASLAVHQLNGDATWLKSSNQSRVAIGSRKVASQLVEALNAII